MASQNEMVTLSSCENIRAQGRNTRGAVTMRLKNGDMVASMNIIPADICKVNERESEDPESIGKGLGPWLLCVSENGYGKRVPLSSF
ncbi:DNA gyrase subunit A, chloroplastic/mitochondrial-like [Tripterygium wilfordii]|uniref:DNA gyrase subunit A, chloroplastic/mitochondrial-like n=1 Tax=Tripterygium wilfordii TaxID=458696 RepID=UPI0018F8206E|nr:DNA gyrase subunit A, chloroplastic/mitochondrial-like [Tripterygium wilfordii]